MFKPQLYWNLIIDNMFTESHAKIFCLWAIVVLYPHALVFMIYEIMSLSTDSHSCGSIKNVVLNSIEPWEILVWSYISETILYPHFMFLDSITPHWNMIEAFSSLAACHESKDNSKWERTVSVKTVFRTTVWTLLADCFCSLYLRM